MNWIVTLGLFLLTAVAEIVGCYLVLLWAKRGASLWVLAGAAVSLMVFAWLLTRHPQSRVACTRHTAGCIRALRWRGCGW